MDRKMSDKEVSRFMKLAGLVKEDLNEWHPDKEWDEEGDEEEGGEDYPSDEDLFGLEEDADYESQTGDTATMGNINE
jgi:hypothetical protein